MATCAKCKREIWWKKNAETGSMIPVDPVHDPSGNIIIVFKACRPLKAEELAAVRSEGVYELHTNHFATCGKLQTAPA